MTRKLLSIGWRISVLATAFLGILQGITFIWSSPSRYGSVAFHDALHLLPLRGWGIAWLTLGVAVALTAFLGGKKLIASLVLLGMYEVFWGILFAEAAVKHPDAATSGFWPYTYMGVIAFALAMTASAERYG